MRTLRSISAALLLAIASIGLVAATPEQANAYHYRWNGAYNNPYYWNSSGYNYNPYRSYNAYRSGYGNYGGNYSGYSSNYPYYNSYRSYPWGGYW